MHEVIEGIAKTAMDGLRDAEMQYEYAEEAKESGSHEFAMLHIEEAKRRLAGVKEWYDRGMKLMHSDGRHADSMADVFIEHHKQWYRSLNEKINAFKPGA